VTSWVKVAHTADVSPGHVMSVPVGDVSVAVCNVDGTFYAIDDVCTHDGGALDQGELEGAEIECPRHGARFDVRSGRATQLPAFEPVETYPVRVVDDTIEVGVDPDELS
jgi:3-phenylpropionate/trans-cinnamate dioxygenase ferredoxin component